MPASDLFQPADAILQAALEAVDPKKAVQEALKTGRRILHLGEREYDLGRYARVVVVGAGKAGAPMAQAVEEALGERIAAGIVVVKDGHGGPTGKIEILEASHPVPDARGVAAGQQITALIKEYAAPDTLFLCLLSGGGSSLLVAPAEGITLADKQETTSLLLESGADIGEINAIRKHLSRQKGGNLARLTHPGALAALIISDVVGDRLDVIASGPCVPDLSTWENCAEILERRGIGDRIPAPVRKRIADGLAGEIPETPKPGDQDVETAQNIIVSSNQAALEAAAARAGELGFTPLILSSAIEGETKEIARMHAAIAREAQARARPAAPPCCLISGGETTVTMTQDHGRGGRNQEFALAAALDLAGSYNIAVLSAGTDGTDGPTNAAGARCDGSTVDRAAAQGLSAQEYLSRHDAYPFFQALGDLVITGPTRTNVMDIRLLLIA